MENRNLNFHQTFKPEQIHLSALLSIADDTEWSSLQAISEATGIPTGKSSGKVEPHLYYARFMGLLDWRRKNNVFHLSLTNIGHVVKHEDPGFSEKLTLLLCHCMLIRRSAGASLWSFIFNILMPKYQNYIELKYLNAELEKNYTKKVKIAPFLGSYSGLFKPLDLLKQDKNQISISPLKYNPEYIYVFLLTLLTCWEDIFPDEMEITATQLEDIGFRTAFGWSKIQENEVLTNLCEKGFIRINRQLTPFTILRLVDRELAINKLYTELL